MTYLVKQPRRRVRPAPRTGVGGLWDEILNIAGQANPNIKAFISGSDPDTVCLTAAQDATADFDAKTYDLAKNWEPTGFYTPDQVQSLVVSTLSILRQATQAIDNTTGLSIAPGARDGLRILRSQTQSRFDSSAPYTAAVASARASGAKVIDSPGLKQWVVMSMTDASSALNGASYVACLQPWWASALGMFQSAFDLLYAVAKAIVGLSIDIVEGAAGAVIKVADVAGTIITYAKYGAIALGAWWLYNEYKKRK